MVLDTVFALGFYTMISTAVVLTSMLSGYLKIPVHLILQMEL